MRTRSVVRRLESRRGRIAASTIVAGAVAAVLVLAVEAPHAAAARCDRVAAPSGSDRAAGTAARPFRTAQQLADSLRPGQVGCLAPGLYEENLRIRTGGRPGRRVVLTSRGKRLATIRGRVWIDAGGDWVTLTRLRIDGRNSRGLPSPTVSADHVTLDRLNITNHHTGICVSVGSESYRVARGTVISRSRIHDCGVLPPTNLDHGIYVDSGRNTRIVRNFIYENADRGIQLFPNAQRTTVVGNVIYGNGVGVNIGGWRGQRSSNNVIRGNVIANSRVRANVEAWWADGRPGVGNVVRHNCLWRGREGNIGRREGFTARSNVVARPRFKSVARKQFALATRTDRCARVVRAGAR